MITSTSSLMIIGQREIVGTTCATSAFGHLRFTLLFHFLALLVEVRVSVELSQVQFAIGHVCQNVAIVLVAGHEVGTGA